MNKEELRGTGKVFRFSLRQYFKSKATYVLLLVMLLGSAGSVLIAGLSMDRSMEMFQDAQNVYVRNVGTYVPDLSEMPDYAAYQELSEDMETALDQLDEEPYSVLLNIDFSETLNCWQVTAYTGLDSKVTQSEAENLAACCGHLVEEDRYLELGAEPEQVTKALASVQVSVCSEADYLDSEETDRDSQYMVGFAYAVIVYMLISLSTSFITKALAEEKSSKLVELLMVSIKPLALVMGKIFAAMVLVVAGILCAGLGLGLSRWVLHLLGRADSATLSGLGAVLSGLTVENLLEVLVSLLLGYFCFAVLAGLSGASCSTVTESDSAGSWVMLISGLCYMTGLITAALKAGTVMTIISAVPFLSAFIAPARYFSGLIPFWVLAVSWVLQAITALVLAKLCAGVYGALLIHRGERVKLKQIIRMMKGGERA